jgi:hypothetical protein
MVVDYYYYVDVEGSKPKVRLRRYAESSRRR